MAVLSPFAGVVKHHIQNDLDAVFVQQLNQCLKFIHLHPQLAGGGVARFGGKKANGAVAPIVVQRVAAVGIDKVALEFIKLLNGHEFDAVHPQFFEIGDFVTNGGKGTGVFGLGGGVTGEATHVHLVND